MINVAVIGCGTVFRKRHLPDLIAHPQTSIRWYINRTESVAEKLANKYGGLFSSAWEEAIADPKVQAVYITTPNHLHAKIALKAAENGKHVLVEKPMALSVQNAIEMVEYAHEKNIVLMPAHQMRYSKKYILAKELIDGGELGKIFSIKTTLGHGGPEKWAPGSRWFFRKDTSLGGALFDLGIHKADLMNWLANSNPEEIMGICGTQIKNNCEVVDNAIGVVQYANGILGMLAASWTYEPYPENSTYIYGTEGTLIISPLGGSEPIRLLKKDPIRNIIFDLSDIKLDMPDGSKTPLTDRFVKSIKSGIADISSEDAINSLRVVEGIIDSSNQKK